MARNELDQDLSDFEPPDLSEGDMAEHYAGRVAAALEGTGLVGIIEVQQGPGQIHITARVKEKDVKKVVFHMGEKILAMAEEGDSPFNAFIGTQYLRVKAPNGKVQMKYQWVFSFGGEDLKKIAIEIGQAIDIVQPKPEVVESPLLGPSTPKGSTVAGGGGKKGASTIRG